jgi:hypothetical protein
MFLLRLQVRFNVESLELFLKSRSSETRNSYKISFQKYMQCKIIIYNIIYEWKLVGRRILALYPTSGVDGVDGKSYSKKYKTVLGGFSID